MSTVTSYCMELELCASIYDTLQVYWYSPMLFMHLANINCLISICYLLYTIY